MDNTTDKRNISEEALDEVTGGVKKSPEREFSPDSSVDIARDWRSLRESCPENPYSVAELNAESDKVCERDADRTVFTGDSPVPDAPAGNCSVSRGVCSTTAVNGSKTAFDNFFEKLWWNISRLFK